MKGACDQSENWFVNVVSVEEHRSTCNFSETTYFGCVKNISPNLYLSAMSL